MRVARPLGFALVAGLGRQVVQCTVYLKLQNFKLDRLTGNEEGNLSPIDPPARGDGEGEPSLFYSIGDSGQRGQGNGFDGCVKRALQKGDLSSVEQCILE